MMIEFRRYWATGTERAVCAIALIAMIFALGFVFGYQLRLPVADHIAPGYMIPRDITIEAVNQGDYWYVIVMEYHGRRYLMKRDTDGRCFLDEIRKE
ncbi:MAG: hypothetical protein WC471_03400 [Candidatus Woesearchaeota archaeon]